MNSIWFIVTRRMQFTKWFRQHRECSMCSDENAKIIRWLYYTSKQEA